MHLGEQEMEEYALGLLPPMSVPQFEMHLLVCDRCQDRLAELDVFVAAMRAACADFRAGKVAKMPAIMSPVQYNETRVSLPKFSPMPLARLAEPFDQSSS
jgi:anti-sigma factor RsiW